MRKLFAPILLTLIAIVIISDRNNAQANSNEPKKMGLETFIAFYENQYLTENKQVCKVSLTDTLKGGRIDRTSVKLDRGDNDWVEGEDANGDGIFDTIRTPKKSGGEMSIYWSGQKGWQQHQNATKENPIHEDLPTSEIYQISIMFEQIVFKVRAPIYLVKRDYRGQNFVDDVPQFDKKELPRR